jgi:hypothetical protein
MDGNKDLVLALEEGEGIDGSSLALAAEWMDRGGAGSRRGEEGQAAHTATTEGLRMGRVWIGRALRSQWTEGGDPPRWRIAEPNGEKQRLPIWRTRKGLILHKTTTRYFT